jgi:Bacterial membrane protein YfhO
VAFGTAPGPYVGAVILLAVPLALRARRRRPLVWAFGGAVLLTYVLMLDVIVTAPWFRWLMLKIPFGDVYLHNPGRLRYLAVVALPILGAVGIQGLFDTPLSMRRSLRWLAVGATLWLILPIAAGGHPFPFLMLAIAVPWAAAALAYATTRRSGSAALVILGVLTAELLAGAVWASVWSGETVTTGLEAGLSPNLSAQPLRYPNIPQDDFLVPPSFVRTLRHSDERYLTWAPPAAAYQKGYLFMQDAKDRAALAMSRGSLFSIHEALGYNPVQLPRYWRYLRAVDPLPMYYNAAVVNHPTPSIVRLLGVRWLTVPDGVPPPLPVRSYRSAQGYRLYELTNWEPRVSVTDAWKVVPDQDAALAAVEGPGFDPAVEAVVETDPGIARTRMGPVTTGSGTYTEDDPEHVSIGVDAATPSVVVIRTSYDPGWHATVDGRAVPVLPTDAWLQGIPVNAGRHDIRLTYSDPDVIRGLWAGVIVWFWLLLAWGIALVRERARRRRREIRSAPGAGSRSTAGSASEAAAPR